MASTMVHTAGSVVRSVQPDGRARLHAPGCQRIARPCLPICAMAPRTKLAQLSRRTSVVVAAAAKTTSTVKIIIQGRRLEVTDAIKGYVESKLTRALHNFGQEIKQVDVTISARGGDTGTHGPREQKVDVTIYTLRNGIVRVEDSEETLYASIDIVCDKLQRKMIKVKERAILKGKWPGRAGPKGKGDEDIDFQQYKDEVAYETAVFDKEEKLAQQFAELNKAFPAQVMRTKVVELDPITAEEAIDAMEAVGHDFYVFRDLETDELRVLYRRASEGYGVLIPKKRD